MTETQWRFLKAISDRVRDGGIIELRLFPAIRQGGAESGVAVVAVEERFMIPDPAVAEAALSDALQAGIVSGDDQLLAGGDGEQLQLRAAEVDSTAGAEDAASADTNVPSVAAANARVLTELPFADRQDFEDATRGFVGTAPNENNPQQSSCNRPRHRRR